MRRIALICFGTLLWVHPILLLAAGFQLQPPTATVGVGDVFDVVIGLDVSGESVNALEGTLTYDPARLELVQVNTSRSAVNLWMKDPAQTSSTAVGRVEFSGVTPGGIGEVLVPPTDGYPALTAFVPRFRALASGDARVAIDAPGMYRNDGEGTAIAADAAPLIIAIADSGSGASPLDAPDAIAPFAFTITISQDEHAFDGKRFASFMTTDKGSGIDHYEVSENGGTFTRATSPYVLEDQDGHGVVRVRAIDRSGNTQEAFVRIGGAPMTIIGWCILAVVALCGFIAAFYRGVWRSRGVRR